MTTISILVSTARHNLEHVHTFPCIWSASYYRRYNSFSGQQWPVYLNDAQGLPTVVTQGVIHTYKGKLYIIVGLYHNSID